MYSFCNKFDHKHMAPLVRELGPALFERLVAVKLSEPLKSLNTCDLVVRFSRPIDRTKVLEWDDLSRAVKSRAYSGSELAVLKYMLCSIRHVGHFVGMASVARDSIGYYVISADDIASYDGNLNLTRFDQLEFWFLWAIVMTFALVGLAMAAACGAFKLPLLLVFVPATLAFAWWYASSLSETFAERRLDYELSRT